MRSRREVYMKIYDLLYENFQPTPGVNYHIFAGATKPFHAGHDQMIMKVLEAADRDPLGQALIFIGLGNRPPVRGEDMGRIWQEIIEPYYRTIDPGFHLEYGGGPVGKVLQLLGQANQHARQGFPVQNKFFIYSDPKDTQDYYLTPKYAKRKKHPDDPDVELPSSPRRYTDILRAMEQSPVVFMGQLHPELFTRGGEQGTIDISGSDMRDYLEDGDIDSFYAGLPDWMNDNVKTYVFGKLSGRLNEARKRDNLILGQEDFTYYLEEIMDEIQYIKSSYGSRKKAGKQYRKEASKLQDAYSTLRQLKRRNERMITKRQPLQEDFSRENIRSFLSGKEVLLEHDMHDSEELIWHDGALFEQWLADEYVKGVKYYKHKEGKFDHDRFKDVVETFLDIKMLGMGLLFNTTEKFKNMFPWISFRLATRQFPNTENSFYWKNVRQHNIDIKQYPWVFCWGDASWCSSSSSDHFKYLLNYAKRLLEALDKLTFSGKHLPTFKKFGKYLGLNEHEERKAATKETWNSKEELKQWLMDQIVEAKKKMKGQENNFDFERFEEVATEFNGSEWIQLDLSRFYMYDPAQTVWLGEKGDPQSQKDLEVIGQWVPGAYTWKEVCLEKGRKPGPIGWETGCILAQGRWVFDTDIKAFAQEWLEKLRPHVGSFTDVHMPTFQKLGLVNENEEKEELTREDIKNFFRKFK